MAPGLTLLDWRRQVTEIYREVRAADDPRAAHARWRERRQELFGTHPESPDREITLRYAPYDAGLRFVVDIDTAVRPLRLDIATATDGVVPYERVGQVHLDGVGTLDVWWASVYGGGLWVPLRDRSPGTYPGGRYVVDTVKGADLGGDVDIVSGRARLVVDLNFAYNPSCAYDEAWACPLAPDGNTVAASVRAGELMPSRV